MPDFAKVFSRFLENSHLKNTFGEPFYKNLIYQPTHPLLRHRNQLLFKLEVLPQFCNYYGAMHGGALATILDCATTLAIMKADKHLRKTVSADMGLSYLNPAKLGDILLVKAECTKIGNSFAFSHAKIFIEGSEVMVISGRHVKAVLKESYFGPDEKFDNA